MGLGWSRHRTCGEEERVRLLHMVKNVVNNSLIPQKTVHEEDRRGTVERERRSKSLAHLHRFLIEGELWQSVFRVYSL